MPLKNQRAYVFLKSVINTPDSPNELKLFVSLVFGRTEQRTTRPHFFSEAGKATKFAPVFSPSSINGHMSELRLFFPIGG